MTLVSRVQQLTAAISVMLTVAFATAPAHAGVVLSATGDADVAEALGASLTDKGAALGFTLGADYTNVSIEIDAFCVTGCDGEIVLFRGPIGPLAEASGVVDIVTFDAASLSIGIFNVPILTAGDYFLVVGLNAGGIIWNASSTPTITTDGISMNAADFIMDSDPMGGPIVREDFRSFAGALHFDLTGTLANGTPPSEVPLPASAFLFAAGLGMLGRVRRRKANA